MAEFYHVFVYGTLKPGERNHEQFCAPYLLAAVDAIAPGRLYDLPLGYPAMTLEDGWVQGVRLTFADPAVLRRLDELEDYYPEKPLEESEYQRLERPLTGLEGQPLGTAWVYTMPPPLVARLGGKWLPKGVWSGVRAV